MPKNHREAEDKQEFRSLFFLYQLYKMAGEFSVVTQSLVNVQITSSISDFPSERRYAKDLTIADLKVGKVKIKATPKHANLFKKRLPNLEE